MKFSTLLNLQGVTRRRWLTLLSLLASLLLTSNIASAQSTDWKLVWSDEFDGKSLDFSKWEIEVNVAIEWEEGGMRWYVDGRLYQTQREWNSDGGKFPAPFDQSFHMILNLAIGGGFVGNPDGTTEFPRQLLVDFVRVSQRS